MINKRVYDVSNFDHPGTINNLLKCNLGGKQLLLNNSNGIDAAE